MDLSLSRKVILITGGSDGLGAALAESLVAEGACVAVCARDEVRLDAFATALAKKAADADAVLGVAADVTNAQSIEAFLVAAVKRWGRIDGIVNNAGARRGASFERIDDDAWYADLDLKLMAAVRLVRAALPHLRAAGGGSVINVLNHLAKTPTAGSMPTSVSRAAGLCLTKALSREFAADGIRVNAILVGLIESGQWRRLAHEQGVPVEDYYASRARDLQIPLGRVGNANEFADLACFLLSARSAYITGAGINLDGGLCATV